MRIHFKSEDRPVRTMNRFGDRGFTVIELLVVIAIIAVLVAMLLPSLSKAKVKALSGACLGNLRQLQMAWRLYADDHGGSLCSNYSVGLPTPASVDTWHSLPGSWVVGNAQIDASPTTIQTGTLFPYTKSLAVYHCPADLSLTKTNSKVLRLRSYMLDFYLNGMPGMVPKINQRLKTRLTQITSPSPAMVFAFLDVSEREICDGAFFLKPMGAAGGDQMYNDIPSDRHAQGGNSSFVDGHVEHHPWRWPKPYDKSHVPVANNEDLQDMRWLQERLPGP